MRLFLRTVFGLVGAFFALLFFAFLASDRLRHGVGPLLLVGLPAALLLWAAWRVDRPGPRGFAITPPQVAPASPPAPAPQALVAPPVQAASAFSSLRIAAVDVETTGLDPQRCRVIEVGVVIAQGGELVERRSWLVNPGRKIPKAATRVNGIMDEDVAVAPPFSAIAQDLARLLEGSVLLAYHAPFDRAFLLAEFARAGVTPPLVMHRDWIDPCVWARALQPQGWSARLQEVAPRVGVTSAQQHRAAADAETALRVFYAFTRNQRFPRTLDEVFVRQRQLG